MIQVNAMGDACPIPVVKTLQALKELHGAGTIQTLVDNKVAVENLTRLAESKGCTIETAQLGEKEYRVTITVGEGAELPETVDTTCAVPAADNTVVAVSADHMGEGDEVLGKILLKGFLFALTQQETLPKTVLFYNARRRDLRRFRLAGGSAKAGIAGRGDPHLRHLSEPLRPH